MGNTCCTGQTLAVDNEEQQGKPIQMLKLGKDGEENQMANTVTKEGINPSEADHLPENAQQTDKNETPGLKKSQVHFQEDRIAQDMVEKEKGSAPNHNQHNSQ